MDRNKNKIKWNDVVLCSPVRMSAAWLISSKPSGGNTIMHFFSVHRANNTSSRIIDYTGECSQYGVMYFVLELVFCHLMSTLLA